MFKSLERFTCGKILRGKCQLRVHRVNGSKASVEQWQPKLELIHAISKNHISTERCILAKSRGKVIVYHAGCLFGSHKFTPDEHAALRFSCVTSEHSCNGIINLGKTLSLGMLDFTRFDELNPSISLSFIHGLNAHDIFVNLVELEHNKVNRIIWNRLQSGIDSIFKGQIGSRFQEGLLARHGTLTAH